MKAWNFKLLAMVWVLATAPLCAQSLRVVVWDERQPKQKKAYENFLGGAIAAYLQKQEGLQVKSVGLDDPGQGLSAEILDDCDVLVWWGHVRQAEISVEKGKEIVARIKAGKLSLIVLHSAHWCTPFVEAMYERTRLLVQKKHPGVAKGTVTVEYRNPPRRYFAPKKDTPLTPAIEKETKPDGSVRVEVELPNCCFPAYRPDGKPSKVTTVKPDHAIARGIPERFTIPWTEMYNEPFHVPEPDEVIFKEHWKPGEWFRSGCVWNVGKGKVFYFRPGHETYPIFKEAVPLKIMENAVRWLGGAIQVPGS